MFDRFFARRPNCRAIAEAIRPVRAFAEPLEARRLLISYGAVGTDAGYFIEENGADIEQEWIWEGGQINGGTATFNVSNLPEHTHVLVSVYCEIDTTMSSDPADEFSGALTVSAGSGSSTVERALITDTPYWSSLGTTVTAKHTSGSLSFSVEGTEVNGAFFIRDIGVAVYKPTASIGGGGTIGESQTASSVTMTVYRDGGGELIADDLSVELQTLAGSSLEPGVDYEFAVSDGGSFINSFVTIPATKNSVTITFTPLDDNEVDSPIEGSNFEYTSFAVAPSTDYSVGSESVAVVAINDDSSYRYSPWESVEGFGSPYSGAQYATWAVTGTVRKRQEVNYTNSYQPIGDGLTTDWGEGYNFTLNESMYAVNFIPFGTGAIRLYSRGNTTDPATLTYPVITKSSGGVENQKWFIQAYALHTAFTIRTVTQELIGGIWMETDATDWTAHAGYFTPPTGTGGSPIVVWRVEKQQRIWLDQEASDPAW